MLQRYVPSPVEQRDRALARVRSWTWGFALIAAGLVGLFSILAASTFPGRSSGTPGSSSAGQLAQDRGTSGDDSAGQDQSSQRRSGIDSSQVQGPPTGFFGNGGGRLSAISGGS